MKYRITIIIALLAISFIIAYIKPILIALSVIFAISIPILITLQIIDFVIKAVKDLKTK